MDAALLVASAEGKLPDWDVFDFRMTFTPTPRSSPFSGLPCWQPILLSANVGSSTAPASCPLLSRHPPVLLRRSYCDHAPASDIIKPRPLLVASAQFIFFRRHLQPSAYLLSPQRWRVFFFRGTSSLHLASTSFSLPDELYFVPVRWLLTRCLYLRVWHVTPCDSCARDLQSNAHCRQNLRHIT